MDYVGLCFPCVELRMMSRFARESKHAAWCFESVFRCGYWRRFHFCNFAEQVRLSADAFKVWISLTAVIVDLVGPKEIFILDEQLNRFVPALRLPDRGVEIVRTPLPPIHRNHLHARSDSGLRRGRPGDHVDDFIAVFAAGVAYQKP